MDKVPMIEGISPEMLWTFAVVLVGLAAVFILGYKVVEIFRKERERRQQRSELNGADITDRIAEKVMEKLQPKLDEKFDEIDRKLQTDKEMIDMHTRQLNAAEERVNKLDNDSKALCHCTFALVSHSVDGNNIDRLKRAEIAMKNYLIDNIYREEAWQ